MRHPWLLRILPSLLVTVVLMCGPVYALGGMEGTVFDLQLYYGTWDLGNGYIVSLFRNRTYQVQQRTTTGFQEHQRGTYMIRQGWMTLVDHARQPQGTFQVSFPDTKTMIWHIHGGRRFQRMGTWSPRLPGAGSGGAGGGSHPDAMRGVPPGGRDSYCLSNC